MSHYAVFQQTFECFLNVVFWLIQCCDMGQRQINVETTLYILTLPFTTSNQRCLFQCWYEQRETMLKQRCHLQRWVSQLRNHVVKMTISKKNEKIFRKENTELKVLTTILMTISNKNKKKFQKEHTELKVLTTIS